MAVGIEHHKNCVGHVVEAKRSAALAGAAFGGAKGQVKPGDWDDWCGAHGVPNTTADRYIAWYEYVMALGRASMPGLEDEERILDRGIEAVMPSPKAWTSLMRYNGLLLKQGQYDPDGYQRRKGTQTGQLEFDFFAVVDTVAGLQTLLPQMLKAEQLATLEERLLAALARVRELRGMTVDVGATEET